MQFANISMLYLLWLVFFVGLFLLWATKRKRKIVERFVSSDLIERIAASYSHRRQKFKMMLILGVFLLAILALLRPQWGYQWQEVKRQGLDIIVAIDTSKSMLTQDVKPNRLSRTKLAVKDLVKLLEGDRVGLIAFAGDAFLTCPLTVD